MNWNWEEENERWFRGNVRKIVIGNVVVTILKIGAVVALIGLIRWLMF